MYNYLYLPLSDICPNKFIVIFKCFMFMQFKKLLFIFLMLRLIYCIETDLCLPVCEIVFQNVK